MDYSFDSCCSDDTVLTPKKPALPDLLDETSRDSGIGHDDDVTDLSAQSDLDTNARSPLTNPHVTSAFKLNFRSLRSLSFDSPSEEPSSTLFSFDEDLCVLDKESFTPLTTHSTFKFAQTNIPTLPNEQKRKRPSPIRDFDDTTPVIKRRCGMSRFRRFHSLDLVEKDNSNINDINNTSTLSSSHSNEELIKDTLDRVSDDANLISDGTKSCCLPTIAGKHQDLKSISSETLAKVVDKEYADVIGKYVIVDCRYPYEFEGGHVKGAVNYYTRKLIMENLVDIPCHSDDPAKRTVLIFHCEFSSERGPKLSRFLRALDREQNKDSYPFLFYPEIYLLHGGYKDFFGAEKELCEPQTYVPMVMDGYKEDLKKFRVKSKSWAGEKQRFGLRRGLNF